MSYWSILFPTVWFLFHNSRINCQNCYPSQTKQFNEIFLAEHNKYRKDHQASPLVLDDSLIISSTEWSLHLIQIKTMQHSVTGGKYGENLWYMGGQDQFDPQSMDPVKNWYDEVDLYNYDDAVFSSATGHFTQVVWKRTKKMGCGVCSANNKIMITCRYTPPGNFKGEFEKNVGVASGRGNHRMPSWMLYLIVAVGVIIIFVAAFYFVRKDRDDNGDE